MPPLYPATAAMILVLASLPVPSPRRHGPVPNNPLLMSDRVTRNVATLVHVQYTCIWLLLNLNKLHGVSRVPGVRRRCTGRRPGPGRKTARAPNPCVYLYVVKGRSSRAGRRHRTFAFCPFLQAGELKLLAHGVYEGVSVCVPVLSRSCAPRRRHTASRRHPTNCPCTQASMPRLVVSLSVTCSFSIRLPFGVPSHLGSAKKILVTNTNL